MKVLRVGKIKVTNVGQGWESKKTRVGNSLRNQSHQGWEIRVKMCQVTRGGKLREIRFGMCKLTDAGKLGANRVWIYKVSRVGN